MYCIPNIELPREVLESLSLDVIKAHVEGALRDMVSGQGSDGWMVGLDDLGCLFQP